MFQRLGRLVAAFFGLASGVIVCSLLWQIGGLIGLLILALVLVAAFSMGPYVLLVPVVVFVIWTFLRRDSLRASFAVVRKAQSDLARESKSSAMRSKPNPNEPKEPKDTNSQ